MQSQRELFAEGPNEAEVERFKSLLRTYGWMTRAQLGRIAGWSERTIRSLAEAAGSDVVRGRKGFAVIDKADLDDIKTASRSAISQGKKMIRYGIALLKVAHRRVG